MSIITALIEDHRQLGAVFAQIDAALPRLKRLAEVKRLARYVESLLVDHAAAEEDLVLLALDQSPEHRRWRHRLYREHQEIDGRLTQVAEAADLAHARRLLREALLASRRHFQYEESFVFPRIEQGIEPETLLKFARVWKHRRQEDAQAVAMFSKLPAARAGRRETPSQPRA